MHSPIAQQRFVHSKTGFQSRLERQGKTPHVQRNRYADLCLRARNADTPRIKPRSSIYRNVNVDPDRLVLIGVHIEGSGRYISFGTTASFRIEERNQCIWIPTSPEGPISPSRIRAWVNDVYIIFTIERQIARWYNVAFWTYKIGSF